MRLNQILGSTLLTLCLSISAFAMTLVENSVSFDFEQNTQYLNLINEQLLPVSPSQVAIKYDDLIQAQNSINTTLEQAKTCIENTKQQLNDIQQLLQNKSIQQDPARYPYLTATKNHIDKKNADCSFYALQAQRTLQVISTTLTRDNKNKLFEKTPLNWRQLNSQLFSQLHYRSELFYQSIPTITRYITYALLGYLCALFMAKSLIVTRRESIRSFIAAHRLSELSSQLFFFITIMLSLRSAFYFDTTHQNTLSDQYARVIGVYGIIITLRLYVALIKQNNPSITINLYHRISILATVLLLGYIGNLLWLSQPVANELNTLLRIISISLLNLSFLWINWLIFDCDFFKQLSAQALKVTKMVLLGIYGFTIALAWNGYPQLAQTLIPNLVYSFSLLVIFLETSHYLGTLFVLWFQDPSSKLANKIHLFFGLKAQQKMIEAFLLRWVTNLPLAIFTWFILAKLWGASQFNLDLQIKNMQNGIPFLGVTINAIVVNALFIFCFIALSGRAFARHLSKNKSFKNDIHRQEMVRLVVTYLAFSIGLIFALIRMNVDFSKIALIAGGLSVGLGIGLKELVSDLINGIILLLTKPIKIGDHVKVDNIEGYIKSIGLFSTQLLTLSHSVSIIPNSSIRNKALNNYTFEDKSSRITIQVLLEPAGNLELAKQILLDITLKNIHVIQTKPLQPLVLFDQILNNGTLSFMLNLVCHIKDVDIKDIILSDLNLTIVQTFKEHNLLIKLT